MSAFDEVLCERSKRVQQFMQMSQIKYCFHINDPFFTLHLLNSHPFYETRKRMASTRESFKYT